MKPLLAALLLAACCAASAQAVSQGVGRPATAAEIRAWDIDVRPDFKGLPAGSGSVGAGQAVWDGKCASCHGVFGEANHVFPPIVGGTTPQDIATGRVAGLTSGAEASRTTFMKLAHLSTLWDYINRAMPWNAPKPLSADEVYAVTAYMLHLADIVPADHVLSDKNIAATQARLPNRNGLTREHGLWRVKGAPDVRATACMSNCNPAVQVVSSMPAHARDAHGNLADQMRSFGGVRGAVTAAPRQVAAVAAEPGSLAAQHGCVACHAPAARLVGPSFAEIGKKYAAQPDAVALIAKAIRAGGQGVWGATPMPPQPHVPLEDAAALAQWIIQR
jgi:S-disulfanyl-L-cysteine oxidoreductase SoxD